MPKPKPVNWGIIEDGDFYEYVQDLITKYHNQITGVSIVLMWRYNIKPDPDGFILLADVSRSADKYRELRPHDFIIGINKDAWSHLDDAQRKVVIDCQLERIAICTDKQGEPKEDDRARTVYRLKKPQSVDDTVIKARHNMTLDDVHEFVFDKFNGCNAEDGSYVAEKLADQTCS